MEIFFEVNKKSMTSNMILDNAWRFIQKPIFIKLYSTLNGNPMGNGQPFFFRRHGIFSVHALSIIIMIIIIIKVFI